MENNPPPHLKLERKKLFYSSEIIQTTPEMNLIFDVSKFLVSSGVGLSYNLRIIVLGIILLRKYTK